MSYFAKVNSEGIVEQVIIAEQYFINTLNDKDLWVETDRNTLNGIHYDDSGNPDNGTQLRKNFAAVGFTYDSVRDAFIPPKPWSTWLLDEETCVWYAPIPYPRDGKEYQWDNEQVTWVEVVK